MAFRPFRMSERKKKVIMGGLVIVAMLTFVLASGYGRGDIFDRIAAWIGRSQYPRVTTLYGNKVDTHQIEELRMQRFVAEQAIQRAFGLAMGEFDLVQKVRNKLLDPAKMSKEEHARLEQQEADMAKLESQYGLLADATRNSPRLEGLLDFLVWRHQADSLNIRLTPSDVANELAERTLGHASLDKVVEKLQGEDPKRFNLERIQDALADEFRVRLAKKMCLAFPPPRPPDAPPLAQPLQEGLADVPPYDFYEYVQQQRTTLHVELLSMPVEKPSGNSEPLTEQDQREMQALFNRYRNVEPQPNQSHPGFKEPRRIKLEWVSVQADSEYYRKKAAEVVPAVQAATEVLAATGSAAPEGGLTAAIRALALTRFDAKAAVALNAAELLLGPTSLGGPEALPSALSSLAVSNYTSIPSSLPHDLAVNDLKAFWREMQARHNKPEEVRKWLPKAVEEYHLSQLSGMKEALPEYELGEAPELQPLKEAWVRGAGLGAQAEAFGRELSAFNSNYSAMPWPNTVDYKFPPWDPKEDPFVTVLGSQPLGNGDSVYIVRAPRWGGNEQPYLVWRSADIPPKVLDYDQARDKVEAAWRFQKARAATRMRANELMKKVEEKRGQNPADEEKVITQLAAEQKLTVYNLSSVGHEVAEPTADPATRKLYASYKFPESIRYPRTTAWIDQMLDKLHKPGDATVLTDEPERTFYVAILVERFPVDVKEFYAIYRDSSLRTSRDQMLQQVEQKRQEDFGRDFTRQLRILAGADENGNFKIDPEYQKTHEDRGETE